MSAWVLLLVVAGIATGVVLVTVIILLIAGVILRRNRDEGIDYRQDPDGRVTLLDTPRMRADAAMAYDAHVAFELSGHQMSNGESWNDVWLRTIGHLRSGRSENAEWYVGYIIQARRKAGLPELVGLHAPTED